MKVNIKDLLSNFLRLFKAKIEAKDCGLIAYVKVTGDKNSTKDGRNWE